ncbi:sulfurtransferase [Salinibacterium sp. ZJ70]|uniref:sulfurtransferase n=1 Tax=Salinibacterium sp. ZJ70 TaxID=2708084 RepID=UPI001424797D|nr:sulfurtransferase [Salinibacterium sp. ZJ70]
MDTLISVDELAAELASSRPPRVLDVRWRLDAPDGRPAYREGHIPTAVYVDLEGELARHGAPATEGRHPLPSRDELQAAARSWGVNTGDRVVVYDDLAGMSAARAWWLLTDAGLDVRVLDGALAAWKAAGKLLETGDAVVAEGNVDLDAGHLPALTIDAAAALPQTGVLLDARAGERYRGETEPIDPRAGHIPGAVSAPTAQNVGADGRFLSAEELRAKYAALGIDDGTAVGVYCGSGVTASHQILALRIAGLDAALFPGSWSAWSNTDRPAATGPTAEGAHPGA